MAHKPLKNYLACVAIDIGTTGTGYAFSTLEEFRINQLDVTLNDPWTEEFRGLLALKAPTCILFDPTMKFHAFGYEAENKYTDLATKDAHGDWYYFERFKLHLFKTEVSLSLPPTPHPRRKILDMHLLLLVAAKFLLWLETNITTHS